jgi:hypothetical protein
MPSFEALTERLLKGGMSYRHVRRYVAELQDHYEDARQAELAGGARPADAAAQAWRRLGDVDSLANGMLARPEFRAVITRYPRLIFGLGPVMMWLLGLVGTGAVLVGLITAARAGGLLPPPGVDFMTALQTPLNLLLFGTTRIVPVILGAAMMFLAVRQRMALHWPIVGVALMAGLAGTTSAAVTFAVTPGAPNSLSITSSFLGPFAGEFDLAADGPRTLAMFAAMMTPLLLRFRVSVSPRAD